MNKLCRYNVLGVEGERSNQYICLVCHMLCVCVLTDISSEHYLYGYQLIYSYMYFIKETTSRHARCAMLCNAYGAYV